MKKIKRFLKNNKWVIMVVPVAAMWLWFFYMVFGLVMETAQFHATMNAIAG